MELKNLEIIDNTNEGLGVAKSEEGIVFVKGGLVGDIVDVEITQKKKNFSNGYVKKYLKYSEYRENLYDEKLTDIYHFINLKYEKELELKKKMFLDSLRKNTGIELEDIEILENKNNLNYRNKIELKTNENFELCYCVDNGESKIKLENCPLSDDSINKFLPFLQEKLKEFKVKSYDVNTDDGILKNISIRSNYNSEIMITVVVKENIVEAQNFVKSLNEYEKLVSGYININPKKASIIMGQESKLIFSKKNFTDKIGKYEFNISPKSFFQVNRFQTENLYKIAKDFLGENKDKNLLDLYSGIGTTSIYFSENFKKVIGVEVVKDAVKDAKENLKLNDVKNVEFLYGKSEEKIEEILKNNNIDIISVDPPRKGLDKKVVDTIIKSNIKKVVYVSCNGATLTRDLKHFIDGGFELKKVKLCDMFSKTAHCEVVVDIENYPK